MVSLLRINSRRSVSDYLSLALFVLLAYAAWARGGVYSPWQWPLASLSVLLLGGMLFVDPGASAGARKAVLTDPVFYVGLGFLLLLAVQWANSGYYVVWDNISAVGMDRLPSLWIPWSVEPQTAGEMLDWFFPAWAVLLVLRHGLDRASVKKLLYLMVWNAALLSMVGMVQQLFGAQKMLGFWTIPYNSFFATFGYVNYAGAFFYLHAALAAGLAHHAVKHHLPSAQIVVWVGCFVLCLAGSLSSLSRAAGFAGLVLVAAALGVFIRRMWQRSKGNQVVNAIGLACIIALTGAVLYFGAGEGALAQEIQDTLWGERMEEAVAGRTVQLPGAWEIAKEYPVFGCGGWGYRWMALLHIPVEEWHLWRGAGRANVHCDPLQFLVEFGLVGSLLMAGVVGVLVYAAIKQSKDSVLARWIGLGLLLVFLHSFVDLPYRCPAILLAWCALLAALPLLSRKENEWMNNEWA